MRVHGTGPGHPTHGLMLVGEGPGKIESATGTPFHPDAPAGAELTRYLNGHALPDRDSVFITNLVKEWAGGSSTKKPDVTPADVERDEWELRVELETIAPRIVVTLGLWSTRWFLGPNADMGSCHGILFQCWYCPKCGQRTSTLDLLPPAAGEIYTPCPHCEGQVEAFYVLPVYHPAAGLHQPDLAARTAYDFAQLAALLKLDPDLWQGQCWTPAPPGSYIDLSSLNFGPCTGLGIEVGIDTEWDPITKAPWGLSVADTPGVGSVLGNTPGKLWLAPGCDVSWIFHFYGADAPVLKQLGVEIDEDHFHDTGVMAYLLGVEPQALKDLALRHLGRIRKTYIETVGEYVTQYGKPNKKTGVAKPLKKKKLVLHSLDEIPVQTAIDYAGADADDTRSLKPILWQKIQALGLEQVYEIDRRVLPLYSRMEQVGMPVDLDAFAKLGADLKDEIEIRTISLQYEYPGFNPASADQVAALLFDHLHLPGYKKTPTGKRFTTNDKILQALAALHPAVDAIIDWREVSKLKNTFVDPIAEYCRPAPDGSGTRLFYQLLPTRVVSGRLAAKDPNILAFPKYGLGKKVRGCFRAAHGRRLGSWDLNQIELRVLALDSGSGTLKEMFLSGADLHGRTGVKIFGGVESQYAEGPFRVAAKAVNFSIPMGTTEHGLAEQMRKNKYPFPELQGVHFANPKKRREAEAEVCRAWIDAVLDLWDLRPYISEKHAEARRYGYVSDRWGRKRFLPSVLSPNPQIREGALREAQAFGPQAGARGFMKTIEWRVWREVIQPLRKDGYYIEPTIDVHDDLVCEFEEGLSDLWIGVVGSIFNSTFNEAVPITAKGSIGQQWSDL